MYQGLLEMERKLDWTMMRKRAEVQDALARNPTVLYIARHHGVGRVLIKLFWTHHVDYADVEIIPEPYSFWTVVADRGRYWRGAEF